MNIADHVHRVSLEDPDRVALRHAGASVSYGELALLARRYAGHLLAEGVGPGDRVAIALPNRPELVIAYLASVSVGAIAVTLSAAWTGPELAHGLRDSGARILLADDERIGRLDGARADGFAGPTLHLCPVAAFGAHLAATGPAPMDLPASTPAAIVYSSGTTGIAKGCVLSHDNVVSNSAAKVEFLGLRGDDRLLLFVPLSHCFGQNAVLNAGLQAGATVVMEAGFAPARLRELAATEQPTRFFGPPTAFHALLDQVDPASMSCFKYYFSAAAPMSVATALRFEDAFGLPVYQGYGLTETSPFATYNHRSELRLGSVGTPITDVSVRLVDPQSGAELATEEVGEVLVAGPNVMLGYWGRPDETRERIRDGWLRTGDLGRLDADGYLYLVDRVDDLINVAGQKVYPVEVEAVLRDQSGVLGAAAYPVADEVFGQRVGATVVLAPVNPADPDELLAACRRRLAAYKVPVALQVASELPVSPTGKLLRRQLRGT